MKQKTAPAGPSHSNLKTLLIVAAAVIGSFLVLNIGVWAAYYGRAYPGVKVSNQALGNLNRSAIQASVSNYTNDYSLEVQVKGESQTVTPEAIGLVYDLPATAERAVQQGKAAVIPVYGLWSAWRQGAIQLVYNVDQAQLEQVASQLAGSSSVAATDAKVVIEGENVRVEAAKAGQGVDVGKLTKLIEAKMATGGRQASISEQATEAQITTEQATAMVTPVQEAMKRPLTLQVNGRQFTPGPAEVGKWLVVAPNDEKKLAIKINEAAVKAYVASVAAQTDVATVNKKINMVNGSVTTVNQGKNGLALDQTAAITALSQAVTSGGAPAVVGTTKEVAFKTITNNTVDLNGKYIEINLARQHLWAYQDKVLVYESAITSGATGAGFPTIQGLFSVKAKQTNRNLNGVPLGYDYNVFVQYWMPFSGNYGMHDASWRSSFGGADYYYGGSHGCVNLPTPAAAWLYNWATVGTPVWVHS